MRVVIFCSSYLPTQSSGGTVRAVAGLAARLGGEHELYVFSRHEATQPSTEAPVGCWHRRSEAVVYYAARRDLVPNRMSAVISALDPEGYYVNSLLSPAFGILPVHLRWLGAIPRRPLILAPRGELHPAALRLKRLKKQAFLGVARRLPAYSDVLWHAGTAVEASDIRREFGVRARVTVARDLSSLTDFSAPARVEKRPGELSIACLARITPVKNLAGALRILANVRGRVHYNVYGPIVEPAYYAECIRIARDLPSNVRVTFEGEVDHDRVIDVLAGHHLLFLPTLGESFGHAILEALVAGCLLLVSDQTPWRNLKGEGVGWDLPLTDERAFVDALHACVAMNDEEFAAASSRAHALGVSAATSQAAVAENRALFEQFRG